MQGSVWTAGGCRSWYLDRTGRNSTLWPGFTMPFRRRLRDAAAERLRADRPARPRREPAAGPSSSPLRGRVVLVTGAARGIGEAVAREVAARGGQRGPGRAGARPAGGAGRELRPSVGPEHYWAEADVTDQAALDQAVAGRSRRSAGIDVVVANAGVANTGTVATNPADALARIVEVNLIGAMRTVSATLPHVLAARGHYLLVASVASFTVAPGLAAYCASKAGVEAFGDAFRLEVAHRGVTVGTAHPIWVDTDLVRDAKEDLPLFRRSIERMPGPLGRQIDVADLRPDARRRHRAAAGQGVRAAVGRRWSSTPGPADDRRRTPSDGPRGGADGAPAGGPGPPAGSRVRPALDRPRPTS